VQAIARARGKNVHERQTGAANSIAAVRAYMTLKE
jgi:hypothetical protein